jgi:C4-dicarboxylate transporter DctM subunit
LTALLGSYAVYVNWNIPRGRWDLQEIGAALRHGGLALALPVLLLGGIYSGHLTPTESAALALVYTLIVELAVHRELEARDYYQITAETTILLGMLLPLIAFATSLSVILDYERVPQALVTWVQGFIDSRVTFLVLANLLLLLAGCFMEVGSAIVILAPLLMPLAKVYGVDPVHFGIIMTVNLEIGYITPPVGLNLFVALAAFKASFGEVCKAVVPFIILMLLGLAVVSAWPGLTFMFTG